MDSETDLFSDSDYSQFANELLFVGDILQPFQFEPVFTSPEIQAKKDLAGTSASDSDRLLYQRCQLVWFTGKPYGFLRFAWAYGHTMQFLQIFMIFADSNSQSFHALYSNCC